MSESETQSKGRRKPGLPWKDIMNLLERVTDETWEVADQAAFLKVVGPQGHRLYVAKQENVRRIDLTFHPGTDGITKARKHNGAAEWELDIGAEGALKNLEAVLTWMKTASAQPVEKKRAFVPQVPRAIAQRRAAAAADPEEKERRRQRMHDYARQNGVEISPNADLD